MAHSLTAPFFFSLQTGDQLVSTDSTLQEKDQHTVVQQAKMTVDERS